MTAALADPVAPRSGGIWKSFHIALARHKLGYNNENTLLFSCFFILFTFQCGFCFDADGLGRQTSSTLSVPLVFKKRTAWCYCS